jgi:adenine deaminase
MKHIDALNAAAQSLGCDLEAPFMTLSFLSLSPIPDLKLTDQGLIDATNHRKTDLFV